MKLEYLLAITHLAPLNSSKLPNAGLAIDAMLNCYVWESNAASIRSSNFKNQARLTFKISTENLQFYGNAC